MKIYITGCAVSGTTLLLRMFYSFKNVEIIDKEIKLNKFMNQNSEKILIGKRTSRSIFSNHNPNIIKSINIINNNKNLKIINIIRDGRDVIESGKVDIKRWISSIESYQKYGELIDLNIKYEDLIFCPNETQKLIAYKFDLEIKEEFSKYPSFVPEKLFLPPYIKKENIKRYGKRKISKANIHKNLELYKTMGNKKERENFEKKLKILGYI